MAGFGLPRGARLLSRADFASLREKSNRTTTRSFAVEYRTNDLANARMGVAISRRVSKLAVQRNRIRRTIRESFRQRRVDLPALDMLIIARSVAAQLTNAELRNDLELIWRKLAALKPSTPLKE